MSIHLIFSAVLQGRYCYPHFTNEKRGTERPIFPKLHQPQASCIFTTLYCLMVVLVFDVGGKKQPFEYSTLLGIEAV